MAGSQASEATPFLNGYAGHDRKGQLGCCWPAACSASFWR